MDTNDLMPRDTAGLVPRITKNQNIADEFHKRLIGWINNIHRSLDEEHAKGIIQNTLRIGGHHV